MAPSPRILIVKLSAIGDCLHATPAAEAIRRAFPGAHIGWLVHSHCAAVLEGNPNIDIIHRWDRKNLWQSWGALKRELRAVQYDSALDLQGLMKSALACIASGAKRIGPEEARELAWLFYQVRTPDQRGKPIQQCYLNRAAYVGANIHPAPRMVFPFSEDDLEFARQLIPAGDGPVVALNPSAGKPFKQWPPERFGAVANDLSKSNTRLLITGAPADQPLADGILEATHAGVNITNLVGKTNLKQLGALLSQCNLFIGGDTGPMHIAQAVGCRVLALFGPTNPEVLGPKDPRDRIIYRQHADRDRAMEQIPVEDVIFAARELIGLGHGNVLN